MSLDIWLNCECCGNTCYEINITHNLCEMAGKAGIYKCLWRALENGYNLAEQLIKPLKKGIAKMEKAPDEYKIFNPPNGWGNYNGFLNGIKELLKACEEYPETKIITSR